MGVVTAVKTVFAKYADFTGVASRSEYWWWVLVNGTVNAVIVCLSIFTRENLANGDLGIATVLGIGWNLGTFVPSLAVLVRRYRDAGESWKMLFFWLIPLAIIALIAVSPFGQLLLTAPMELAAVWNPFTAKTRDVILVEAVVTVFALIPYVPLIAMWILTLVVALRRSR